MSNNNTQNTINKLSEKLKYYRFGLVVLGIVALVLVFTIQSNKKDFSVGKFPLLDPARVFLDPDDYLLNIQALRTYLHGLEEKYPDSISIYYEQLNSGSNIAANKELRLFPASLSKLVQAIIIAKKVEEGVLSWSQKLDTRPEDISLVIQANSIRQ